MNGPDHYSHAMKLLADPVRDDSHERILIATAQVHATLALVAATVETANSAAALMHSWDDDTEQPHRYGGPWGRVLHPDGDTEESES